MIDETNPAGRLYKILTAARGIQDGKTVREAWTAALNLQGDQDEVSVTRAVLELIQLSDEVKRLIRMDGGLNHDLYLKGFKTLEKSFMPLNLAAQWKTSKAYLTPEALHGLQFCADHLAKTYSEETLTSEELEDIREKTDRLYESFAASSLPEMVRYALLEEVERIRLAITMYRIKGAKGLKEALQATLGAVYANNEVLDEARVQNPDTIQRLTELLDKLDSFSARALKLAKIVRHPFKVMLEKMTDPLDSEKVSESGAEDVPDDKG